MLQVRKADEEKMRLQQLAEGDADEPASSSLRNVTPAEQELQRDQPATPTALRPQATFQEAVELQFGGVQAGESYVAYVKVAFSVSSVACFSIA